MLSTNAMVEFSMLAALVLPAWLRWRMRRSYISMLPAIVLSCWFMIIAGWLPIELHPDYDGIGGVMTMTIGLAFSVAFLGVMDTVIGKRLASGKQGRYQNRAGLKRCGMPVGLVVWTSLCTFCLVAPFVVPPCMQEGVRPDAADYILYYGPIFLLASTMSLTYLLELWGGRASRQVIASAAVEP